MTSVLVSARKKLCEFAFEQVIDPSGGQDGCGPVRLTPKFVEKRCPLHMINEEWFRSPVHDLSHRSLASAAGDYSSF
jgi:hypothetical protein